MAAAEDTAVAFSTHPNLVFAAFCVVEGLGVWVQFFLRRDRPARSRDCDNPSVVHRLLKLKQVGDMRRLQYCFALALVRGAATFQPVHRRTLASRRSWSGDSPSSVFTSLHASSADELKAELSNYLRKREEANADDAAKS